eukprot:GEMP01048447.1.p1 GENE.GEMP01048447.1~~GEMP01048447.1.p1  ORF type:complete len:285 (-),score=47.45 GEMP01048447.1:753-1607(-)
MEWKFDACSESIHVSNGIARRNTSKPTGALILGRRKSDDSSNFDNGGPHDFDVMIEDLDDHWSSIGLEIGLTSVAPADQLGDAHNGLGGNSDGYRLPETASLLKPPLWLWTHDGLLFDGTRHLRNEHVTKVAGCEEELCPATFRRGDVVNFGFSDNGLHIKINDQTRGSWPDIKRPADPLYPIVGVLGRIKSISIPIRKATGIPYEPTILGEVTYRGHRAFIRPNQSVVDTGGVLHTGALDFVNCVDRVLAFENARVGEPVVFVGSDEDDCITDKDFVKISSSL